ncbi:alpha-amylase [Curtobacterium sp. MCBD17_013]|uniref:glycoside hydrolase family 13 protein n=1 Tax=Curtobacterium sp. MCBD17_013 TaxID=2175668 RepID=UPI000DA7E338|nr:glycoside hydrolase family 13 protein [Curtobacterium sp. MCBD17_013]PZF66118.1 alpha-amylase [Curtobacterium sp. MCBD17_013]
MSEPTTPGPTARDDGEFIAIDGTDPDWWRQAVVYQVYPRSFADSNGDGLGDIAGVTSRVPYLQRLGVDAIWLSPFYPSALADGGYDVADYRNVDPRLGTLDDFDAMVAAAHDAGIKVIVDIVPNHSSNDHAWFREALAAEPGSAARERYVFRDGLGDDGQIPPSTWQSNFGGSAWTRTTDPDGTPGQWYLHLFAPEQPDFNWANPEIREDFHTTLRFWADCGVDGFRVDVAHALAKDLSEPLRDANPKDFDLPLDGSDPLYDRDEVHEIFSGWRRVFDEYDPPRTAVAEAWVPSARVALYARPTELGQAFNFDLLRADFDAGTFSRIIDDNLRLAAESGASSTWVLSNHDVIRHASRYALPAGADEEDWLMSGGTRPAADETRGLRRARAATLLLLALPGSAYLYQGEELGLREVADLREEDLQDPVWVRSAHTRKGRDGCRVPLPWDTSTPAFGFGPAAPHLPQPAWFADLAVSVQDGAPDSTLELYRAALRARHALQQGEDLRWLDAPGPDAIAFARHDGWVCAMNFGTDPVPAPAGSVVVASGPLTAAGVLPGQTTVWVRP